MANKGIWSTVMYPESTDIDTALDILRGAGARCMWILHDKDKNDKGEDKKPHYHVICGWVKGFPDYGKFVEILRTTAKPGAKQFIPPAFRAIGIDPPGV